MSYYVQNIQSDYSLSSSYSGTFTTGDAYNESLKEVDNSISATIQYVQSLKNQIAKAFLTAEITDEQFHSLLSFLIAAISINENCPGITKNIYAKTSIENEIIFYRKTSKGVCLLSIDSDGDVLLNYTGYKSGFETTRKTFEQGIDFEHLIYNFLSK